MPITTRRAAPRESTFDWLLRFEQSVLRGAAQRLRRHANMEDAVAGSGGFPAISTPRVLAACLDLGPFGVTTRITDVARELADVAALSPAADALVRRVVEPPDAEPDERPISPAEVERINRILDEVLCADAQPARRRRAAVQAAEGEEAEVLVGGTPIAGLTIDAIVLDEASDNVPEIMRGATVEFRTVAASDIGIPISSRERVADSMRQNVVAGASRAELLRQANNPMMIVSGDGTIAPMRPADTVGPGETMTATWTTSMAAGEPITEQSITRAIEAIEQQDAREPQPVWDDHVRGLPADYPTNVAGTTAVPTNTAMGRAGREFSIYRVEGEQHTFVGHVRKYRVGAWHGTTVQGRVVERVARDRCIAALLREFNRS